MKCLKNIKKKSKLLTFLMDVEEKKDEEHEKLLLAKLLLEK